MPLRTYLKALNDKLIHGDATEHTHRPALEALLKAMSKDLVVTNEPKRISVGAPDFVIRRQISKSQFLPVGYVETKAVGADLNEIEKSEQLKRYLTLDNLILTNYTEFRWYVGGKRRLTAIVPLRSGGRSSDLPLRSGGIKGGNHDPQALSSVEELLRAFLEHEVLEIATPKDLAQRMAGLCRNIDKIIVEAFTAKQESELLHGLKDAFERTLLPDLSPEQFADMFAQTLAYGLFAARVNHYRESISPPFTGGTKGGAEFRRSEAAREIPKTNPFLRKLFDTINGAEIEDEPFIGFVDDLTAIMNHADISTILQHFGRKTGQEDPVVHFYETFLAAYDPKLRELRGVYYTPEPVVSYIVRSVDILLKEKFGLKDGLADRTMIEVEVEEDGKKVKKKLPKVLILDPACGTGTFLYHVIKLIRERFMLSGNAGEWSDFVRDHLLPRIYGFELLMAPYAVAHLKLAMQLSGQDLDEPQRSQFAYDFNSNERLNVYLTNSLEMTEKTVQTALFGLEKQIAEEANAASSIKSELPIMVVLGNPPYSNYGKMNKGKWILQLIQSYKEGVQERKLNLDDDFVKFVRFGQWRIEQSGNGILGFITNNIYVDGVTHWKMRQSLCKTFPEIYVLDLHGNTRRKERVLGGGDDENVFDIMQGVAIGLFVRPARVTSNTVLHYSEIKGKREDKYGSLSSNTVKSTAWHQSFIPHSEFVEERDCFFAPSTGRDSAEYTLAASIVDIFPNGISGIESKRDHFAYDFERKALEERVRGFIECRSDIDDIKRRYALQDNDWSVEQAHASLKRDKLWPTKIHECLYRPFDQRWVVYSNDILARTRGPIMACMIDKRNHRLLNRLNNHLPPSNLAMVVGRQGQVIDTSWNLVFCSRLMTDRNLFYRGGHRHMPLYMAEERPTAAILESAICNMSTSFLSMVGKHYGLQLIEAFGDLKNTFGPEDIFNYIYAIFHSPTYRKRYAEFLKIDFPRVPITSDVEMFRKLVSLGGDLVKLHLVEFELSDLPPSVPPQSGGKVIYPEKGDHKVERVSYVDVKQRVMINKIQYFEGVPPDVWEFHIGGYQVAEKWLKDRKGRVLTAEDREHYRKIIAALAGTIHLMQEIDKAIPQWPIT